MVPSACGIVEVDDLWGLFFCLEEGVVPAFGDVHEFVDDFLILLVEVFDLLLRAEVHGVVAKPMHFLDGISLHHTSGTLLADGLEPLQVAAVFELPLHLVERLGLPRHCYIY